jgi:hypothetical protein
MDTPVSDGIHSLFISASQLKARAFVRAFAAPRFSASSHFRDFSAVTMTTTHSLPRGFIVLISRSDANTSAHLNLALGTLYHLPAHQRRQLLSRASCVAKLFYF